MNWADIKTNLNCLGSQPPIQHCYTTYYFKGFKSLKISQRLREAGFDIRTHISLTSDSFCRDPSARLLQAAGLNFYGYEKPRVRVFCSECFWSRPGLSQCENLLVIDCYTPTGNVVRGSHAGFDQEARVPESSLSLLRPSSSLLTEFLFLILRASFLTQTQWWFPGKVSMNTSQFWLQPELPSPPPPGLLAWTKRIDYPKDFSSLFPIYLFISLTLNNPSWQLMRLICYPITRLSRDFLSHFRFSRVSPHCANLFGKLLKSCSGKQNEDNLCRIIQ